MIAMRRTLRGGVGSCQRYNFKEREEETRKGETGVAINMVEEVWAVGVCQRAGSRPCLRHFFFNGSSQSPTASGGTKVVVRDKACYRAKYYPIVFPVGIAPMRRKRKHALSAISDEVNEANHGPRPRS